MNASEQAAELQELLILVRDSKTAIYATVASLALLLFDYTLTFSQEVDLVWRRRLTWGKVLFLTTRYFGILSHVFNTGVYLNNTAGTSFCLFATRFQTGSSNVVLWLVEFTFAIRVWLLYNRSNVVLFSLVILYLCSITTVATMCVKALLHHAILQRPGPFLSGCYGEIPSYFFNVLIAPAITTSVLMGLTAYKTIQTMKESGAQKPPMVQLLLRDGILYFIAVFAVLIANIMIFHLARVTLSTFATGFFVAIPCMVGSRLFLNVREKLLHPNPTFGQTLSTFEMKPYGSGVDNDDATGLHPPSLVTSPSSSGSEPNSATALFAKHTPWTANNINEKV